MVSQPDRGRGRGRRRSPSPVAARALLRGVALLRPEAVGAPEVVDALRAHAPDIGVVVAFGQFIPRSVRELPRLGYLVNAHASLLPRHRGASPIAAAILAGDEKTGVSVMRVERRMDTGAVACVRETKIDPRETAGELGARLADLAAEAILEALEQISDGTVTWAEQDEARATIAPRLDKEDGRLDWSRPTAELGRRIHALAPQPGAFTELPADSSGAAERLRILRAEPGRAANGAAVPPGTVRLGDPGEPHPLEVATGDGWLAPLEVQRPGGRAMDVAAFLRGRAIEPGMRLGGPARASAERADA